MFHYDTFQVDLCYNVITTDIVSQCTAYVCSAYKTIIITYGNILDFL